MTYCQPKEIAKEFGNSSETKSKTKLSKFILLSILGGIFISLGGLLTIVVAGGMPEVLQTNPGLVKFIAGCLFPVGLIMVVVAGADLFTSDCAGMTLSTMQKKTTISQLLKVLLLSYCFNFIGTQLVSYSLVYKTGIINSHPYIDYLHNMVGGKLSMSCIDVIIKAIWANILVCLGVWMGFAGKDIISKIIGIWVPIMIFVTFGLEHSIANMFFIPSAIYTGANIEWSSFILNNLIPSTIGNIIGGSVFIGMVYGYIYNNRVK